MKNAKQYQKKASGDARLSFEKGGSIITIKNTSRTTTILQQAEAQINAAAGTPIRWEVSTDLGARGIRQLFNNPANYQAIRSIEVVHVPQITVIP